MGNDYMNALIEEELEKISPGTTLKDLGKTIALHLETIPPSRDSIQIDPINPKTGTIKISHEYGPFDVKNISNSITDFYIEKGFVATSSPGGEKIFVERNDETYGIGVSRDKNCHIVSVIDGKFLDSLF